MKYKVNVYYEYVASIDVEADTPEQASAIGYNQAEGLLTEDLTYVGYTNTEVWQDNELILTEN